MGNSLQDQLLKAGVADSAQAKKAKSDKRKQAKQKRKNKLESVDQDKGLALKAVAEKKERDRRLNQQKAAQAEQKAIFAQVKQIIEANRLLTGDEEIPFNFVEDNKVKKVYVSEAVRDQISRGKAAIVKLEGRYEVVASEIAEKIRARDENRVVYQAEPGKNDQIDDDPYKDYKVPDDLIW